MVITSTSNNQVKEIKRLKKEKDFLFLDNPKLIDEAVHAGLDPIFIVFEDGKENESLKKFDYLTVSKEVFKTLSSTENSQGVCSVVKPKNLEFEMPKGNFLVLDEVQDPGNVGTLIRSALAFGFNEIYLINCASKNNEKVVRSTMGAVFKTKIFELSRNEFVEKFKGKTNLYCGEMGGENISNIKFENPCGIVVGNEGNGVSKELKQISKHIAIPMKKNIESLNAGVAGSIMMFEICKK